MKITIIRNTGIMGGLANVSILVNDKARLKLQNNEEKMIMLDKDEVEIQVIQWFLHSKKITVTKDMQLEIKINTISKALFLLAFLVLALAVYGNGSNQQILFTCIGLLMLFVAILCSMKSFFIFEARNKS